MRARTTLTATAVGAGSAALLGGAGIAAQRRGVRRLRNRPDPHAAEPFGSLRGRPAPVRASDGTRLYAEVDGEDRTDLAIVFSHGWTLTQDSWHFQRRALRDHGRLVLWDQRGHGRSDGGAPDEYGLPRLAHDLADVIDQTVPAGTPVVLVGHSLGGMTVQRFADEYPHLLGDRVVAAALCNTSSGGLGEVTLGLPALAAALARRTLPRALRLAGAGSSLIEKVRHLGRDGVLLIEDHIAFGPGASPTAVAFAEQMATDTRMDAVLGFLHSMITHDVISECAHLTGIETLVLGGEHDLLTPVGHTLRLAAKIPTARLEVLPDAGHMAMLERPDAVTHHLTALITRTRKNLGI
ncbi:alpha/beta fold hydrolase [Actinomadura harenae]|uniref:Alpha/beta hydrolase n=1 Tax=Actinomadura harenae TaxID=2483351 RepID=A0A3M2MDU1_9ACTN|nr:alpha/beta hydrolase [Actinomadura harenae]RMI47699.1 alpha/beta hydrolase [Actinomadura harenae]